MGNKYMEDFERESIHWNNLFSSGKKDPKEEKVIKNLLLLNIDKSKYKINSDYTVDINSSVTIIAKNIKVCPVKFNTVNGNFIWHFTDLESAENLPLTVKGNLSIANNKITTLTNCSTKMVSGTFICSGNKLKNLKGMPLCDSLVAYGCGLETLRFIKDTANSINLQNNNIKSLEYCPKTNLLDVRDNKIKNLDGLNRSITFLWSDLSKHREKVSELSNKQLELNLDIEEPFIEFKENDKVILDKVTSTYHNLIGTIRSIGDPGVLPEKTYNLIFLQEDNPSLTKNGGLVNVSAKFLKPYHRSILNAKKIEVGDYIRIINPNSKYKGFVGEVEDILESGIKARFEFDINPGLKEVATNKTSTFINISKLELKNIEKISKEEYDKNGGVKKEISEELKLDDFEIGGLAELHSDIIEIQDIFNTTQNEKVKEYGIPKDVVGDVCIFKYVDHPTITYDDGGLFYVKTDKLIPFKEPDKLSNNTFERWDVVSFPSERTKYKLLYRIDPAFWKMRNLKTGDIYKYQVHFNSIKLASGNDDDDKTWMRGDRIIFLDPDGPHDELHGNISYVSYYNPKRPSIDVRLIDNDGKTIYKHNVNQNQLERDTSPEPPKPKRHKVNDKIIYVSTDNNDINKDCHLRNGVVTKINDFESFSYDIRLYRTDEDKEKLLYYQKPENVLLNDKDFKKGDKVIYLNEYDKLDGDPGIISKVDVDGEDIKYSVTFNDGKEKRLVTDITPDMLIKYYRMGTIFLKKDDEVIYTKQDSNYYGFMGVILTIDKDDEKPYSVNIADKSKGTLQWRKIKTTLDNLEKLPKRLIFKKGDRIQYHEVSSPFDSTIGTIDDVFGSKGNEKYRITLKGKNNSTISLTCTGEKLILLEEAPILKIGTSVKYHNSTSKYDGKIGEYKGTREKEGKTQYQISFDNLTVYADDDECTLEIVEKPETSTTTIYTTPPKKKKKSKTERDPVLVYNRRPIARKVFKKKIEDAPNESQ